MQIFLCAIYFPRNINMPSSINALEGQSRVFHTIQKRVRGRAAPLSCPSGTTDIGCRKSGEERPAPVTGVCILLDGRKRCVDALILLIYFRPQPHWDGFYCAVRAIQGRKAGDGGAEFTKRAPIKNCLDDYFATIGLIESLLGH